MMVLMQKQFRMQALGTNSMCVTRFVCRLYVQMQASGTGLLTKCVRQLVRQTNTLGLVQLAAGVSAVGSTAVHAAVLGTGTEVAGCGLGQRVADFPCFRTEA